MYVLTGMTVEVCSALNIYTLAITFGISYQTVLPCWYFNIHCIECGAIELAQQLYLEHMLRQQSPWWLLAQPIKTVFTGTTTENMTAFTGIIVLVSNCYFYHCYALLLAQQMKCIYGFEYMYYHVLSVIIYWHNLIAHYREWTSTEWVLYLLTGMTMYNMVWQPKPY